MERLKKIRLYEVDICYDRRTLEKGKKIGFIGVIRSLHCLFFIKVF